MPRLGHKLQVKESTWHKTKTRAMFDEYFGHLSVGIVHATGYACLYPRQSLEILDSNLAPVWFRNCNFVLRASPIAPSTSFMFDEDWSSAFTKDITLSIDRLLSPGYLDEHRAMSAPTDVLGEQLRWHGALPVPQRPVSSLSLSICLFLC